MTRQRKWQLARRAFALCTNCGSPAEGDRPYCPKCLPGKRAIDREAKARRRSA